MLTKEYVIKWFNTKKEPWKKVDLPRNLWIPESMSMVQTFRDPSNSTFVATIKFVGPFLIKKKHLVKFGYLFSDISNVIPKGSTFQVSYVLLHLFTRFDDHCGKRDHSWKSIRSYEKAVVIHPLGTACTGNGKVTRMMWVSSSRIWYWRGSSASIVPFTAIWYWRGMLIELRRGSGEMAWMEALLAT